MFPSSDDAVSRNKDSTSAKQAAGNKHRSSTFYEPSPFQRFNLELFRGHSVASGRASILYTDDYFVFLFPFIMLVPASRSSTALLSSLLFSPLAFAYTLDCGAIQTEGVKWDLSKLGGPHSVMHSVQEEQPLRWVNTTFTVDICKALERPGSGEEKENFCQGGTRGM